MSEPQNNLAGRLGGLFHGNTTNLIVLIMLGVLVLTAILVLPNVDLAQWLHDQGLDITLGW